MSKINVAELRARGGNRYSHESLEVFKCSQCSLIFIGVPDSHFAFYDSEDLNKKIVYNRPEEFTCPHCNYTFPTTFLSPEIKDVFEVTTRNILSSSWRWLLKNGEQERPHATKKATLSQDREKR